MTEILASHIEQIASYAPIWGFALIIFFMTVESSFIPFPSEVVMIPAGFLAWRGELTCQLPWLDLTLALLSGLGGSLAGAYINYYLARKLGRPFLHKYGKYLFLPEPTLNRAEEIFREYGELATFLCRLVPAIRQLISIPAGLSSMNLRRFTLFTALGAGLWCLVLLLMGAYFGHLTQEMTYLEMIRQGSEMLQKNTAWIILAAALLVLIYLAVHKRVMHSNTQSQEVK